MRKFILVLSILLFPPGQAQADVSVGFGFSAPGISVGINLPAYPRLIPVPGYPVYYDPALPYNYFFYDGLYWVLTGDDWYASSWYNGPWYRAERESVPLYLLRVPVRYYRNPPPYFRGWQRDAPPRWGEHWGRDWGQRHEGWDRWNRHDVPRAAPLPSYQKRYQGDRYPGRQEQQRSIESSRYRYQPREPATRQYYQQRREAPQGQERGSRRGDRGHDRDH